MADAPKKSFADRLQSINKPTLFFILIILTSIPLFFGGVIVPDEPDPPVIELYKQLESIPAGKTVLLQSDWTLSTRGESMGQFKSVFRILMRQHVKVCLFTLADPQAPQVARDAIRELNVEQADHHEPLFNEWTDWIHIGYFPNAEGTTISMVSDVRKAFGGKKANKPLSGMTDIFQSPVMAGVHTLKDIPMYLLITASATTTVALQRLSGHVPLAFMVTGVMGPETQPYYDSHQVAGLSKGLKGVYDLETLMQNGYMMADGTKLPAYPGEINLDRGTSYMPSLHAALTLLILAVVAGNVGVFLSRRKAR